MPKPRRGGLDSLILPPANPNTLVFRKGALGFDRPYVSFGILGESDLMDRSLPPDLPGEFVVYLCEKYSRVVDGGYVVDHKGLKGVGVVELALNLRRDLGQALPSVGNMFSELQRILGSAVNDQSLNGKVFVDQEPGFYLVLGGKALFGASSELLVAD